ncbi:MAG TPA: response regulator [Chthoniobacterales bacterium]|jgi:phosphoribosyl 1,2-cyclic phosphodiesterase/CheY-like chemotaxis protein
MKTLVLIDSDSLTRALVAECLAGKDWRVFEAEDGHAGLDLVLKHRPAAVVCDLRTPRRNGFQVCRTIREQPALKSTRVILMTVSRFANDRETAFASGADDYLTKPIMPAELLRMLAAAGDNGAAPNEQRAAPAIASGPTLIRFWGVRGSIPSPGKETSGYGGNTSCVEVRVGDQIIILDAGSGIRRLGQSLMKEMNENGLSLTMLISHTHWDHIQGFPFFVPAYHPRVNIRILGYEGAVRGLRGALFEQMQTAFFPVGLNQMATHLTFEEMGDMQFDLGGAVKVRTMFANHPGICLGYRLTTPNGDIVYLPDHEAYERCEIERQKAERENSSTALQYAKVQDEKVIEFLRDAAVVIADSQYDAIEYPTRRGWGHTCADDTVLLAARAGAKRVYLFHHDPDHSDEKIEKMVESAQRAVAEIAPIKVAAAREGETLILGA